MRQQTEEPISMDTIRGPLRMCTGTTAEFRDRVAIVARQQGMSSQEFVLRAVRDALRKRQANTVEEQRQTALRVAFTSRRVPQNVRDALAALLKPYLPTPRNH